MSEPTVAMKPCYGCGEPVPFEFYHWWVQATWSCVVPKLEAELADVKKRLAVCCVAAGGVTRRVIRIVPSTGASEYGIVCSLHPQPASECDGSETGRHTCGLPNGSCPSYRLPPAPKPLSDGDSGEATCDDCEWRGTVRQLEHESDGVTHCPACGSAAVNEPPTPTLPAGAADSPAYAPLREQCCSIWPHNLTVPCVPPYFGGHVAQSPPAEITAATGVPPSFGQLQNGSIVAAPTPAASPAESPALCFLCKDGRHNSHSPLMKFACVGSVVNESGEFQQFCQCPWRPKMRRNFNELLDAMTPEARARVEARAHEMLEAMDAASPDEEAEHQQSVDIPVQPIAPLGGLTGSQAEEMPGPPERRAALRIYSEDRDAGFTLSWHRQEVIIAEEFAPLYAEVEMRRWEMKTDAQKMTRMAEASRSREQRFTELRQVYESTSKKLAEAQAEVGSLKVQLSYAKADAAKLQADNVYLRNLNTVQVTNFRSQLATATSDLESVTEDRGRVRLDLFNERRLREAVESDLEAARKDVALCKEGAPFIEGQNRYTFPEMYALLNHEGQIAFWRQSAEAARKEISRYEDALLTAERDREVARLELAKLSQSRMLATPEVRERIVKEFRHFARVVVVAEPFEFQCQDAADRILALLDAHVAEAIAGEHQAGYERASAEMADLLHSGQHHLVGGDHRPDGIKPGWLWCINAECNYTTPSHGWCGEHQKHDTCWASSGKVES